MLASSLITAILLCVATFSEAWTFIFLSVFAPQAAQTDFSFCTDIIPPHLLQNSIVSGKGDEVYKIWGLKFLLILWQQKLSAESPLFFWLLEVEENKFQPADEGDSYYGSAE